MIGIMLLSLGGTFILEACRSPEPPFFVTYFSRTIQDRESIATLLLCFSLFVGYMKGRFVLSKSVQRQINRVEAMPPRIPLHKIYSPMYYVLIVGMMFLGFLMRVLPIGLDLRGMIDVAIGFALIQGSMQYMRFLLKTWTIKRNEQ